MAVSLVKFRDASTEMAGKSVSKKKASQGPQNFTLLPFPSTFKDATLKYSLTFTHNGKWIF